MTVYYVDPIGGNDAAAGTSFATRLQSISVASTKTTAGDTVRVIADTGPQNTGINATWTDGSYNLTLASALTLEITPATAAWTASTNVTCTTSTVRRYGATSSSVAVAAGFTTGKAAYFTFPSTVNASAYQQVSFSIAMTAGAMTADGDITIRLCSDAAGNTAVHTISVPRIKATSWWQAYTINTGGALSSGINSIALYVEVDRGAQTFLINNVLACKAPGVDALSLTSMVSKNTGSEPWIGIQNINGTTVMLEFGPSSSLSATDQPTYSGTTATTTLYKREPIQMPSAFVNATTTSTWGAIAVAGTAANRITYSGGWNTTDMSTQTGDTFISGINYLGSGLWAYDNVTIEKINVTKFYTGIYSSALNTLKNFTLTASDLNGNRACGFGLTYNTFDATAFTNLSATITNLCGNGSNSANLAGLWLYGPLSNATVTVTNLNSNYSNGALIGSGSAYGISTSSSTSNYFYGFGNTFNFTNVNRNGTTNVNSDRAGSGVYLYEYYNNTINISSANLNIRCAVFLDNSHGNTITCPSLGQCATSSYSVIGTTASSDNTFDLTGVSWTKNGGTDSFATFLNNSRNNTIIGGTYVPSAGTIMFVCKGYSSLFLRDAAINTAYNVANLFPYLDGSVAQVQNITGASTVPADYFGGTYSASTASRRIATNTATRHTASGYSWKMSVGFANPIVSTNDIYGQPSATDPHILPVAVTAVNASALVTASIWVYRTSTSLTTKLVCPGGQIAGVPADVSASASGAINTWEQLTITFTPSVAGAVALEVQCYGASADVYVDDFSVSQA